MIESSQKKSGVSDNFGETPDCVSAAPSIIT